MLYTYIDSPTRVYIYAIYVKEDILFINVRPI